MCRRLFRAAKTTRRDMAKHGKKYRAAAEKVEQRPYNLDEAFGLLKQISYAKFNETVELSMLLGVDPKHADQMVRAPERSGRCRAEAQALVGPSDPRQPDQKVRGTGVHPDGTGQTVRSH